MLVDLLHRLDQEFEVFQSLVTQGLESGVENSLLLARPDALPVLAERALCCVPGQVQSFVSDQVTAAVPELSQPILG